MPEGELGLMPDPPTIRDRIVAAISAIEDHDIDAALAILVEAIRVIDEDEVDVQ